MVVAYKQPNNKVFQIQKIIYKETVSKKSYINFVNCTLNVP